MTVLVCVYVWVFVCVCACMCDYVPTSPACTCLQIFQCVYFQVIFDLMLSSSFDMDIIHATSGAVYAIICSHEVPSAVS